MHVTAKGTRSKVRKRAVRYAAELDPTAHDAITRFWIAGQSAAQIAHDMHLPEGTACTLIREAMEHCTGRYLQHERQSQVSARSLKYRVFRAGMFAAFVVAILLLPACENAAIFPHRPFSAETH